MKRRKQNTPKKRSGRADDLNLSYGIALTTLGAPRSPWTWDTVNTLTIQMVVGSLASDTEINVLNGSNELALGNGEVIQFVYSEQVDTNTYTISKLLRGRRGTEWTCGTHAANETVVGPLDNERVIRERESTEEQRRQYGSRIRKAHKLQQGISQALAIKEATRRLPMAKDDGLSEAADSPQPANTSFGKLTSRELKIWDVIRRGLKGRMYCRELDNAKIGPRRDGVWGLCPRSYLKAYDEGLLWRRRIKDEKHKIRRKARSEGLAKVAGD